MKGPMTPLQMVAFGLILVLLDTASDYDLLPDFVGWLLVLFGLSRFPSPSRSTLITTAAIAGLVSIALWPPQSRDALADRDDSLVWAALLPEMIFGFLLCRAIMTLAQEHKDSAASARFGLLQWLFVVTVTIPVLANAAESDQLLFYADIGLALSWGWLIWSLFSHNSRPYAKPPAATGATGG
jgi:hypothetical protein